MACFVEVLAGLSHRQHSGASAHDRAKAEAVLTDSRERYLAIEYILDMLTTVDWIEQRGYDSVASESEIGEQANTMRDAWQLGMGAIPSMCDAARPFSPPFFPLPQKRVDP